MTRRDVKERQGALECGRGALKDEKEVLHDDGKVRKGDVEVLNDLLLHTTL